MNVTEDYKQTIETAKHGISLPFIVDSKLVKGKCVMRIPDDLNGMRRDLLMSATKRFMRFI